MMKTFTAIALVALSASAWAQTYVSPHVRKDGTYVDGHMRSAPNDTKMDNYSTKGNTNPYTGQAGTTDPYAQPQQPSQPTPYQQCHYNKEGRYVCR